MFAIIDKISMQVEGNPGWRYIQFLSAIIFISVLFGLMDFSDKVILYSRPKTLSVLICLSLDFFHERVATTVKQICSANLSLT